MAKVMLVEDDNNLREIYQARLQAEGYDIVTAKDGEEALVLAKAEMPDLVISDVMMPKISGFEMLDILRNTDGLRDVKVIMLTALGQSDDQQRADKLGADRYLVKSQVTLEDIVNTAHSLLEDTTALPEVTATPVLDTTTQPVAGTTPPPIIDTPSPPPESTVATEPVIAPLPAAEVAPEPVVAPVVPTPTTLSTPASGPSSAQSNNDDLLSTAADALGGIAPAESNASSIGTSVHKRVIQPLDSEPKRDISALLAEEEAKNSASTPSAVQPALTPAPEPGTLTTNATNPQTIAQEEAAVEASIETFVAGATNAPTAPAAPVLMEGQLAVAPVAAEPPQPSQPQTVLVPSTPVQTPSPLQATPLSQPQPATSPAPVSPPPQVATPAVPQAVAAPLVQAQPAASAPVQVPAAPPVVQAPMSDDPNDPSNIAL